MVYADYGYYCNEYYGVLPIDSFELLILKASKEIDRNINTRLIEGKIKEMSEEAQGSLKYTACALVDLMAKKQECDDKKLSSYSIDGVSKTFKTISDGDYRRAKKEVLKSLPDELTCYR